MVFKRVKAFPSGLSFPYKILRLSTPPGLLRLTRHNVTKYARAWGTIVSYCAWLSQVGPKVDSYFPNSVENAVKANNGRNSGTKRWQRDYGEWERTFSSKWFLFHASKHRHGGENRTLLNWSRSWFFSSVKTMFGKASSSQAPSANKRLFGSSLSVGCQSVRHLSTSFPRDLGNGLSFSQNSMPSTSSSSCSALFTKIDDTRQV